MTIDTPAELRKHAADCETTAEESKDPETKATWNRMAKRWLLCAKLAEDEDSLHRRRLEERSFKPHRNLHASAAAADVRRQLRAI